MKYYLSVFLVCFSFLGTPIFAQSKSDTASVKIGNQTWMLRNLDVRHFRNGDEIFHAKTNKEWKQAAKEGRPAYCYYNNDPAYGEKYGLLYNWYAVNDARGLAPEGWKIPSDTEWATLVNFCGGRLVGGSKLKEAGLDHWKGDPHGTSTNSSGFTALPGGYVNEGPNTTSVVKNAVAFFWTSTNSKKWPFYYSLSFSAPNVGHASLRPGLGMSVRCIKQN
jgi:uncharacterized protein (TIGR02145 family)